MCLIGVKETYVQEKEKVTKNFLGQICTTVSGLKKGDFGKKKERRANNVLWKE